MQMKKAIHLTGKDLTDMVQLRPEDVGAYAIVPGPRDRLDVLMKKIENPVRNFSFMEYTMYTGMYQGIKLTAINGGRFSTDTAITAEVMCNARIKNIIRIGTCGALDENMKVGDLLIVDRVIRGDGVTPDYVEKTLKKYKFGNITLLYRGTDYDRNEFLFNPKKKHEYSVLNHGLGQLRYIAEKLN